MDKITKVLLAIIAFGLLMNAVNPWVRPVKVEAQDYEVLRELRDISSTLSSMESDLRRISRGTCTGPVCD